MENNGDSKKSAWSQQPTWVKLALVAIVLLAGSFAFAEWVWAWRVMLGTASVLLVMAVYLDYRDWSNKRYVKARKGQESEDYQEPFGS